MIVYYVAMTDAARSFGPKPGAPRVDVRVESYVPLTPGEIESWALWLSGRKPLATYIFGVYGGSAR